MTMGQKKGMMGLMSHRRRKIFGTSFDIAGPLDMSIEGPPPTPGMNIHLQTLMKVDVLRFA
ncbi:hypothetical protein E2C01_040596 [Portunus trituberculatus]|uniref:Uncharacterized protein n=1 Tax=Portunus trituberculatus TaxID=210409 RepID=A0A5B7FMX1_PORTR|nr:hypothetical protein [Portunus trituberculatus]